MSHENVKELPPCPISGRPAKRRVHGVAVSFLKGMWKYAGAGDVSRLFPPSGQVVLYESDNGLYFFEPRVPGDDLFYGAFYQSHQVHDFLSAGSEERIEFHYAAKYAQPGMAVLDVGCGKGVLGKLLPHCDYRGLDPYAGPDADQRVIRETLDVHLAKHAGSYDMVTAYHVIEHVQDPLVFAEKLLGLLKPGGILILAAPLAIAPITAIPNFPLNAPPHHLTWWSCSAFQALAEVLRMETLEVIEVDAAPHEGIIYWMDFFSLARARRGEEERYFAHRWWWHLSIVLSYALARLASKILPFPAGGRPNNGLLVARKP